MVDSPIRYVELKVNENVKFDDIASACGTSNKDLALLNPALTDWVVVGRGYVPKGFVMKVPPEKKDKCNSGFRNVSGVLKDEESEETPQKPPQSEKKQSRRLSTRR